MCRTPKKLLWFLVYAPKRIFQNVVPDKSYWRKWEMGSSALKHHKCLHFLLYLQYYFTAKLLYWHWSIATSVLTLLHSSISSATMSQSIASNWTRTLCLQATKVSGSVGDLWYFPSALSAGQFHSFWSAPTDSLETRGKVQFAKGSKLHNAMFRNYRAKWVFVV